MRGLVPLGWFVPGHARHPLRHRRRRHRRRHPRQEPPRAPARGATHVAGHHAGHARRRRSRRSRPTSDPDLFWATAGGMGLTGVDPRRHLPADAGSRPAALLGRHRPHPRPRRRHGPAWTTGDDALRLLGRLDRPHGHAARSMGRSVLDRGRFARVDELPARKQRATRSPTTPRASLTAPPLVPPRLLNPLTVRAFNEVWYRKAPSAAATTLQSIPAFFHPLDVRRRLEPRLRAAPASCSGSSSCRSGPRTTLRAHRRASSARSGCPSFLAVLKRFGAGNPGPAVVPDARAGRSPSTSRSRDAGLGPLLDRLDERGASTPAAASTWPRTAGCGPSCCRPCTPGSTSGAAVRRRGRPRRRAAAATSARRLGLL